VVLALVAAGVVATTQVLGRGSSTPPRGPVAEVGGVKITQSQFQREYQARYQELVRRFNCSNDDFIRTTEERHYLATRSLMQAAYDTGLSERIALIPSICILRTVGGMRFVARNVPGIDVPPSVVQRVEQAADAEAECFDIAYELASHALAQPGIAGLHFISFRKDAGIAKLCRRLGIPPKSEREAHGHSSAVALG